MRGILALLLFAAACGGGNADDDGSSSDARVDAPYIPCDVVGSTDCAPTDKCAWIRIDTEHSLWTTACVPAGSVPDGQACAWGADGPATGYDDCEAGLVCVDDACVAVCTVTPNSCLDGRTCTNDGVSVGPPAEYGFCAL